MDIWIYGYMDIWIYGDTLWIYGDIYMDKWIYGYLDIWMQKAEGCNPGRRMQPGSGGDLKIVFVMHKLFLFYLMENPSYA